MADIAPPPSGYRIDPNGQYQSGVWGQLLDFLKGTKNVPGGVNRMYKGMLGPNGSIYQNGIQKAALAAEAGEATDTDSGLPPEAVRMQHMKAAQSGRLGALADAGQQNIMAQMHLGDMKQAGYQAKNSGIAGAYGGMAQVNPYAKKDPSIWRNILQYAIQGGAGIAAAAAGKPQ